MKNKFIQIRVSEEEKDKFNQKCKELGCTYTQYFFSLMEDKIDFATKKRTFEFLRNSENYYAKVESNINQVARIVNTEKQISNHTLEEFNFLLRELVSIKNDQLDKTKKIYLEVTK
jgi:antitoxin component of RelBE/YafQ-DinJ toxin-antitoxin module